MDCARKCKRALKVSSTCSSVSDRIARWTRDVMTRCPTHLHSLLLLYEGSSSCMEQFALFFSSIFFYSRYGMRGTPEGTSRDMNSDDTSSHRWNPAVWEPRPVWDMAWAGNDTALRGLLVVSDTLLFSTTILCNTILLVAPLVAPGQPPRPLTQTYVTSWLEQAIKHIGGNAFANRRAPRYRRGTEVSAKG